MKFRALVAGIVGALMISSTAMAADPIVIPPPAPPAPVAVAPAGFDWSGLYVGGNIFFGGGIVGAGVVIAGAQVGFNFVRNNLLFGAELGVDGVFGGGGAGCCFVTALGKVGLLLGPTDRLLVYGTAGAFGIVAGGGSAFGLVFGGGASLALGSRLSVFAEAITGAGGGFLGRGGVNFHF